MMNTKTKKSKTKAKMPKQLNLSLTKVLAYNVALTGATAVRRWIRDYGGRYLGRSSTRLGQQVWENWNETFRFAPFIYLLDNFSLSLIVHWTFDTHDHAAWAGDSGIHKNMVIVLLEVITAPVWFSLTKTKMVKNEKITNSLTKTKTKTKKWWKLKWN